MTARGNDHGACTVVAGCVRAPMYLVKASGGWGGYSGTHARPAAVSMRSCKEHLAVAQKKIHGRETRQISLLENPQPNLFDQ